MNEIDMNKAAAAMFPTMAQATPTAPASGKVQTDEDRQAAMLYPDMDEPIVKPRDRDAPADEDEVAERYYEDSPIYDTAKRDIENAALENLETPEAAAEIAAAYEPWMREWSLSATDASQLTQLGVSAVTSPPSPETVAGWVEASRVAVRQDHGLAAGEALAAARQLIAKDPSLVEFLETTKLGNSPAFVRAACNRAMDLKRRGKL